MTYPTADGGVTSVRGESPPKPPQTDLQRRLDSELQMYQESLMARREKGGPDDLGEVDRELTMAAGALEGLYQRIGALAATLGPAMPAGLVQELLHQPGRASDEPEVFTQVGQRIAQIRRAISECEDVLGALVVNVRL